MTDAANAVRGFLDALNAKDYEKARAFLADDMTFTGVMGTRDNADDYIADMSRMQFRYSVEKIIADQTDVAVFYHIDMGGITAFSAGWYQLEGGKIRTFRVLFDPRPVIEARDAARAEDKRSAT